MNKTVLSFFVRAHGFLIVMITSLLWRLSKAKGLSLKFILSFNEIEKDATCTCQSLMVSLDELRCIRGVSKKKYLCRQNVIQ